MNKRSPVITAEDQEIVRLRDVEGWGWTKIGKHLGFNSLGATAANRYWRVMKLTDPVRYGIEALSLSPEDAARWAARHGGAKRKQAICPTCSHVLDAYEDEKEWY